MDSKRPTTVSMRICLIAGVLLSLGLGTCLLVVHSFGMLLLGPFAMEADVDHPGVIVVRPAHGPINSLAFSPNGDSFASANDDQTIVLYKANGQVIEVLRNNHGVPTTIAFSPSNSLLAAGDSEGQISLWELKSNNLVHSYGLLGAGHVRQIAFDNSGRYLAAAQSGGHDCIWMLDLETNRVITKENAHREGVMSVAFTADGNALLSTGRDGPAMMWPVPFEDHAKEISAPYEAAAIIIPPNRTGTVVIRSGYNNRIDTWSLSDAKLRISTFDPSFPVRSAAMSTRRNVIALGGGDLTIKRGCVELIDATTLNSISYWSSHVGPVTAIAFSPTGTQFVTGGCDGRIKVWPYPIYAKSEGNRVQSVESPKR